VLLRAAPLPESLRTPYYSGAAFGLTEALPDQATVLTGMHHHVPSEHHSGFCEGLLRAQVRHSPEDTEAALALLADLQQQCAAPELGSGIWTGLQEALGDDPSAALQAAASYPEHMHAPLFQEMGWRVGDEAGLDPGAWETLQAEVPEDARCPLARGVVLGAVNRALEDGEPWAASVHPFLSGIPEACKGAALQGLAEALMVVAVDDGQMARLAEGIGDSAIIESLRERATQIRAVAQTDQAMPEGVARVMELPAAQRRRAAERLGMRCAQTMAWADIAAHAEALTHGLDLWFLGGVAQTKRLEADVQQPDALRASAITLEAPESIRGGVIAALGALTSDGQGGPELGAGLDAVGACALQAGLARGQVMRALSEDGEWLPTLTAAADAAAPQCRGAALEGAAEALMIALGHDAAAVGAAAELVSPTDRAVLLARLTAIESWAEVASP
jgi:hypothetical protein